MKKKIRVLLLSMLFMLCLFGCGSDSATTEEPATTEATEEKQPETEETREEILVLGDLLGMSVSEIAETLGATYEGGWYEGPYVVFSSLPDVMFLGDIADEQNVDPDDIIFGAQVLDSTVLWKQLRGSMTYPEICDAVGTESSVPEPSQTFSYNDNEYLNATDFLYDDYEISYRWRNSNPDTTKADEAIIYLKNWEDFVTVNTETEETQEQTSTSTASDSDKSGSLTTDWKSDVYTEKTLIQADRNFYVPSGFYQYDYSGRFVSPGIHTYLYHNDDLDMDITVSFALNGTPRNLEESYNYYLTDDVTYSTLQDDYFVVTGYRGDEIYYMKEYHYPSDMGGDVVEIEFSYPKKNAKTCDKILEEFIEDFDSQQNR